MDKQVFVDGVSDEERLNLSRLEPGDYDDNWDVEALVDQICDELEGAVDHTVVDQVVRVMVTRYRHARVKAFVPIFIRRDAIDLLRRN